MDSRLRSDAIVMDIVAEGVGARMKGLDRVVMGCLVKAVGYWLGRCWAQRVEC